MICDRIARANSPLITALSGHAVLGKKTILDVYMPGDTAGAIACVAIGGQAWHRQQKRTVVEAVKDAESFTSRLAETESIVSANRDKPLDPRTSAA